jgi:hypothetical protein
MYQWTLCAHSLKKHPSKGLRRPLRTIWGPAHLLMVSGGKTAKTKPPLPRPAAFDGRAAARSGPIAYLCPNGHRKKWQCLRRSTQKGPGTPMKCHGWPPPPTALLLFQLSEATKPFPPELPATQHGWQDQANGLQGMFYKARAFARTPWGCPREAGNSPGTAKCPVV